MKEVFYISAQLRDRIVRSAKEIVEVDGIKFLTISRIVSRCRISRRTFYEFFTSKEDLINELKEISDGYEFPCSIKNELILKALDLFSQNGYIDTEMETIAASVGIKRTSIYAYFSCKEELLEHCIFYELEKRIDFTNKVKENHSNPIHVIKEYIDFNCSYSGSSLAILASLTRSFALNNQRIHEAFNQFINFRINKLIEVIEDGKNMGLFNNSIDSEKAAKMYVTMFNGYSLGPSIDLMSIKDELFEMYYNFLVKK
ncbi:MAG: TetR/AcrR family transcriptional regulator [Bacillota bacterium]|nr:TetR/AcrR family transcriptional regulator [Bacillota bacterium]